MANATLPAGTITYSGAGQAGNWSDPANWAGGVVPSAAATGHSLFTSNATLNNTFTVGHMMMLGTEAISVNGTLNTTSPDACTSFMICNGAVVTFSPTATLNDTGGMTVGVHAFGSVTAQGSGANHAVLNTRDGKIGQHANSSGVVSINDAIWTLSDRLMVGESGQGSLTISNGGTVSVGSLLGIGTNQGGMGAVTLASGTHMSVATTVTLGANGLDPDTPAPAGTGIGTGTLTIDAGSTLTAGQEIHVSAGSALVLDGGAVLVTNAYPGISVRAGGMLSGFGTIGVPSQPASTASGVVVGGVIQSSGGTLTIDSSLGGAGQAQIADGSTMVLNGARVSVSTIRFMGSNGTLVLSHGIADGYATVAGFSAGDHILMAGVDALTFNAAKDMLTLTSGGQTVDHIHFTGTYASNAFTLSQTSAGAMIALGTAHTGH